MSPISADFAPKISCHCNFPLTNPETNTRVNIYTNIPENLMKIGLVVSEISLLQAIVKKKKKNRKESNSGIT